MNETDSFCFQEWEERDKPQPHSDVLASALGCQAAECVLYEEKTGGKPDYRNPESGGEV